MRVHLVDGTFELFRAYHGAPPLRAPSGQEVGAVAGLLRSLAALLRQRDVTHVACAFDNPIESFRNRLFKPYKSSAGVPEELLAQFDQAEEASRALGIVTWPMDEYEADDALATAALRCAARPRSGRWWSARRTRTWRRSCTGSASSPSTASGARAVTRPAYASASGWRPHPSPTSLALVGDGADGLPGIPRWGARSRRRCCPDTAASRRSRRIRTSGPCGRAAPRRWRETSTRSATGALLYKRLATLVTDVPIAEAVGDLRWQGASRTRLERLCATLGMGQDEVRPPGWS